MAEVYKYRDKKKHREAEPKQNLLLCTVQCTVLRSNTGLCTVDTRTFTVLHCSMRIIVNNVSVKLHIRILTENVNLSLN